MNLPKSKIKQLIQFPAHQLRYKILAIDIVAFKKQALLAIKEYTPNWVSLFLNLLFSLPKLSFETISYVSLIKKIPFINCKKKLAELLKAPAAYPDMFVWYFQKLMSPSDTVIPFQDERRKGRFSKTFSYFTVSLKGNLNTGSCLRKCMASSPERNMSSVRELLKGTSLEFAKEFLLLISKCLTLSDHDIKILRSLVEVVHPTLAPIKTKKGRNKNDQDEIWTTEEGLCQNSRENSANIGTIEVIENAREIEAARALGDL